MRLRNIGLIAVMVAGLLVTTIGGASASFPGQDTVAFVRYNGADTRIFEMRPNGTEEHKVLGPTKGSFIYASAMAPDSRRVVFSASDGSQFDLFVKRIGGSTKQITDTPNRSEYSPMWSPDGEIVVFMETDASTYSAIVRRDADGSGAGRSTAPRPTTCSSRASHPMASGCCSLPRAAALHAATGTTTS